MNVQQTFQFADELAKRPFAEDRSKLESLLYIDCSLICTLL
jgi:hypothetical protein